MANKFNKFLGDILSGFLDPKGNLGDYQHASRLYVDDTFRLAPKNKFLYYVVFNINSEALTNASFQDRHALELNYLVKSTDLPKYTINTETLNQYNRKTNIYTKITYDPISLSLHDDNNGITNMLWSLYYGYYFNDSHNSSDPYSDVNPAAYQKSTYKSKGPFRYGLDVSGMEGVTGAEQPFFNSIQLFTLSRQRFFSYLLCNPKITKWDHDTMNQSEGGGIVENRMTLAYEAVIYNSGSIDVDDPAGFALLHYDQTPSPIVNEEVLQHGMSGIFGDVFSLNSFASPLSYLANLGKMASPYLNTGNQQSFGYGTPSFYGSTGMSPYSVGGLQNYGFGRTSGTGISTNTLLTAAGIGIAGNVVGNVLKNVFSPSGQRVDMNNASKYGVSTPDNPSGQAAAATANGASQPNQPGSASGTTNPNSATNPDREAGAATGSATANTTDLASGRAAERGVPVNDAYGPPAPSYGRRSEAASDAADLQRSNASMVESGQFAGGEAGSRADRLPGETVSGDLSQVDQAAVDSQLANVSDPYGDNTGFAAQTQTDAAAYDQGGGSISSYGEPPAAQYQGDVVSGYEGTGFV